jgi:hypothetical protein
VEIVRQERDKFLHRHEVVLPPPVEEPPVEARRDEPAAE